MEVDADRLIFRTGSFYHELKSNNSRKLMEFILERVAEIEAACVGNVYNFPKGDGSIYYNFTVEKINPKGLIVDIDEINKTIIN